MSHNHYYPKRKRLGDVGAGSRPARRRADFLRVVSHRCCRTTHQVGLTQKGQLAFSHHTIAELRRDLALAALGGTPCRCALFYLGWVMGAPRCPHGSDLCISEEFAAERFLWREHGETNRTGRRYGDLHQAVVVAARIAHRRRSRRRLSGYRRRLINRYSDGNQTGQVLQHLCAHLQQLGMPVEVPDKKDGSLAGLYIRRANGARERAWVSVQFSPTKRRVASTSQNYHQAYVYVDAGNVITTIPGRQEDMALFVDRAGDYDFRPLADVAEVAALAALIQIESIAVEKARQKRVADLMPRPIEYKEQEALTTSWNYEFGKGASYGGSASFMFARMTPSAARFVDRQLRHTLGVLRRYLGAAAVRLGNPNHEPTPEDAPLDNTVTPVRDVATSAARVGLAPETAASLLGRPVREVAR